jgi:hypothetical protein
VTVRSGEMSTEKQLLDDGSLLTAVKQRYQPDSVRHGLLTNKVFDHNNLFIYSFIFKDLAFTGFFFYTTQSKRVNIDIVSQKMKSFVKD